MKPSIYIPQKDLDKLEKATNKILKEVSSEKTKLLLKEARRVRDRIKSKMRGRKYSSRSVSAAYATAYPETSTSSAVAYAGIRPKKMPQGHLVEYGHGGPHPAPPHPFFRPALDETMPEVERNIEQGLKKTVEGAV